MKTYTVRRTQLRSVTYQFVVNADTAKEAIKAAEDLFYEGEGRNISDEPYNDPTFETKYEDQLDDPLEQAYGQHTR